MLHNLKRTLALILIIFMTLGHTPLVLAEESAQQQEQSTQTQSSETEKPAQPSQPEAPKPNEPTPPPAPTAPPKPSAQPTPTPEQKEEMKQEALSKAAAQSGVSNEAAQNHVNGSGGQTQNGGSGNTTIKTGNATNDANVVTTGNTNTKTGSGSGGSASTVNGSNGANSNNNSSATVSDSDKTNQGNSATVGNELNQSSTTGQNNLNQNSNGNATTTTGDANVTGTAITAINTNVDGVSVHEFNVADDHKGDLVLDYSGSHCISGCGGSSASAVNSGNGANSDNTAQTSIDNEDATFQDNDATVGNSLTLKADSGTNNSSLNTNGDTVIETGDANVSANALTFANNNLDGEVVYGVVNIFGDLEGDIILSEAAVANAGSGNCSTCATSSATAANTGNGAGSENTASSSATNNNSTKQNNDANLKNNLAMNANTGENETSANTGGDSNTVTGEASVDSKVLNIANNNLEGGNTWLVIINRAGRWFGKLVGAEGDSSMAGSEGMEFEIGANGEVTASNGGNQASNEGNGAGSENTASVDESNTETTEQNNTANVENNLNLSANTGKNKANMNTGGDTHVKTGDAKIIANIINFVNNNISGSGKMVVTVVNVFGNWVGDFIAPGQQKQQKNTQQQVADTNQGAQNANTQATPLPTSMPSINPAGVMNAATTNIKKSWTYFTQGETQSTVMVDADPADQGEVAVLGDSAVQPAQQVKNVMTFNLAFLVLALPIVGLGILAAKKRAAVRKAFHELSKNTRQWFF